MSIHARSNNLRVRPGPFSRTFLLLATGLLSLTTIQNRANAATYYLDSVQGNDTNPGTAAQPWQTVSKVAAASQAGDAIYLIDFDPQWGSSLIEWPNSRIWYTKKVSQFGITWTLDTYYRTGRFVNGDFWVANADGVTVVGFTPASYKDGSNVYRNGTMVNPASNGKQGFDSRAGGWDSTSNAAWGVSNNNPLRVPPGSSVISTESHPSSYSASFVMRAAVLTVLSSAPPEGSFRPAYFGTDKRIRHNESDLDYSKLASLSGAGISSIPTLVQMTDDEIQGASVERMFERPWIDCMSSWNSRLIHPASNMEPYGRDLSNQVGIASLMLHLNYTNGQKRRLLIRFAQLGTDNYGVIAAGAIRTWLNNGGQCLGRKWPILFAGLVLNDPDMKAIGQKSGDYLYSTRSGGGNYGPASPPPDYIMFQEDDQTFYVSADDVFTTPYALHPYKTTYSAGTVNVTNGSQIIEGIGVDWGGFTVPPYTFFAVAGDNRAYSKTGTPYTVARYVDNTHLELESPYDGQTGTGRSYAISNGLCYGHGKLDKLAQYASVAADYAEYTRDDIGLPEWGIVHATTRLQDGFNWTTSYRATCGPAQPGWILAAHIMQAKTLWNHNALFDYQDRYMKVTAPNGEHPGARCRNAFVEAMWDRYRADYGSVWIGDMGNQALILASIGSKQVSEGRILAFSIAANDPSGKSLTFSATGLPSGATFSGQAFTWTPGVGQQGTYQVTFTVSNGVEQDSETITITVEAPEVPNTAPVLGAIGNKSIRENESLSFSVSATDAESSPDALTYSASGLPSGATFSGQNFCWTPGYDQAGSYEVTFVVSDGLAQNSETVTVSVANANRPPALSGISDRSVDENNTLAFTISASDPDGGSLTYSVGQMPAGANFSGQNFSWTPTSDQVGVHQITFVASDGELQDSQTISVTVVGAAPDGTAPVVAGSSPEPDAIQIPTNNLVTLHVTDTGAGVKADSVIIRVNDQTVYQGDVQVYTSASGCCSRSGQKNDYRFIYQPAQSYDFDQAVTVSVSAADLQGNAMPEYSYSFMTEMRTFGANMQVGKSAGALREKSPVTAMDSVGNIWIVWHDGPQGNRDIYAAKMAPGSASFQTPVALTRDPQDQCNPDLAVGADGKLYVVWQDNRRGNWDIFGSVCSPGQSFSRESRITDSNDNEINPAVAVDGQSPNWAYVAWQDDRNGNQDIYVAASANSFAGNTVSRVTANTADQVEPDIAADGQSVLYIVWTDMRNGRADIYGAASNAGPWTNVPVVTTISDQTNPVLAAEPGGSALHLLWVDNALGDQEVYYAKMEGLPGSPLTGHSIVDDTSGADQLAPAIACAANGKVFACWQDSRHEGTYSTDTDLYIAELVSGAARTNVLVGDDQTNASQHEPAIGVNGNGQPYVVWTDDRRGSPQIYYAATTCIDPVPLDSKLVVASAGATIGAEPSAINRPEDVSIVIPPGACQADVRMTVSRILNPQNVPVECLGSYEFGPSGIDFDQPVTVTVPYRYANRGGRAKPYWYNSLTGALSQQGITDVENIEISSNLNALRFKTTHFTPFYLVAGDSGDGATQNGIDLYGGCALSAAGRGSPKDLVAPCAVVATTMVILRRRDRRRQRLAQNAEK